MSHSTATEPVRGKTWTLVFGLTLLFVTFGLAYAYVIPRLGCELVSRTSSLQMRSAAATPVDGWSPMTFPDGTQQNVSPDAVWTVDHFSAFQHVYHAKPPQVVLLMSDAGQDQWQQKKAPTDCVVILHDKVIGTVMSSDWTPSQVTLTLHDLSSAEVNEALARLTE